VTCFNVQHVPCAVAEVDPLSRASQRDDRRRGDAEILCCEACWLLSAVQRMVHRVLSSVIGVGDAHFKCNVGGGAVQSYSCQAVW